MRDMVALERKGIATVVISEDAFANAAHNGAQMSGLPALPIVVVGRAQSHETDDDLRRKVDSVFDAMVRFLTEAR